MERSTAIKVGVAAAASGAAYQFIYKPYVAKQEMEKLAAQAAQAKSKGGSVAGDLLSNACMQAAVVAHVPPELAALTCKGAGLLAQKGLQLAAKGAIAAGKGALVAGKAVGKAGEAVGKGVAKGAVTVAYKAPKAAVTSLLHVVGIGGSSKLGRASNNKDVFPNDLANCTRLFGITDWRLCGLKYDLKKKAWPWDAKGNLSGLSPYESALEGLAGAPRAHPLAVHARNTAKRPVAARPRAKSKAPGAARQSKPAARARVLAPLDSTVAQVDPYASYW